MSRVQRKYFTLTPQEAVDAGPYDFIVVGSGVGGGTIAAELFDTNIKLGPEKAVNILVIERGDLLFHSHSLNSARPSKIRSRAQDNDAVFQQFKSDFEVETADWNGGPMYCLGGRSVAWGLFSPRIHDRTLHDYFPKQVVEDVLGRYYSLAEATMQLSIPATQQRHLRLIERLNIDEAVSGRDASWEWGRIASQFHRTNNYYFPVDAWSTVDRLLEIAMSKEPGKEHPKFRILLQAEVRRIEIESPAGQTPRALGVTILAFVDGAPQEYFIPLRQPSKPGPQPTVVLCAGSVQSAAILLRSKVPLTSESSYDGCHITDHEIFYTSRSFRYKDETISREVGGMKLQTYLTNLPSSPDKIFLANMAIDSSSFLPRGDQIRDDSLPQFVMAIIGLSPLFEKNSIRLDHDEEPVVHIERAGGDGPASGGTYDDLQRITEGAMAAISQVLDIEWISPGGNAGNAFWQRLPLGGVAHELGSIPMPGMTETGVSPEVNPTLTLTALVLRLTHSLLPSTFWIQSAPGIAIVMNQSGGRIRVQAAEVWQGRGWHRLHPLDVFIFGPHRQPLPRPGDPEKWPFIDSSLDFQTTPASETAARGFVLSPPTESAQRVLWGTSVNARHGKDVVLEPGQVFVWTRMPEPEIWRFDNQRKAWCPVSAPGPEPILVWRLIDSKPIGPETYVVQPGGDICTIPALTLP
ncbi:hypothetical protein NM688_g5070 [Phlebia brevispora]|uniref:Uncharacterized protein n=1 Tax=Phlebia brevispora TaxID=194682 RepID=A0ACC1T0V7_9APHY|nr:hypothetical protein NM688_g5070 [Phlebia brevispora]